MALIESMLAMAVLSVAALAALGSMTQTSAYDDDVKERALALRAAQQALEEVTSYDWGTDFQNFIDHWSDESNTVFTVQGLEPPKAASTTYSAATADNPGKIVIDAADPTRIKIAVTIRWWSRGENRILQLPFTFGEVER